MKRRRARGMSIILTMIILATALATVVCSQPPAQKTIVIDGDLSDWSGILGYPENYVIDLIEAMGDLDYPTIQSADKDMIKWAYTWNSTHVFYYFKRNAGSNNVAQFLVYMDLDNDGYMNSTDKVARIEFDGQNKKCVDSLHDYAPTGGTPDMIMGDGYSMPGGVTNEVNDATFDPCSADGLQVEVSYKWEDLGATSGTPLRFHISSGRKGTNLPSAVEDNAGNISSRYAGVDIEASQNKGAKANTTITYIHNVTNFGNDIDTIDIEAIGTRAGWNVTIYDDSWNELTDSDLDGKADLIMNAGETKTIYVNFTIPADEDNGISDDTTIKATSSITPSLYDTVEDITTIGTLILLNQHDYLISSGASITYTHTVMNLNDPDVVEVAVKQTSDWNYALRYPNGTEIDDTDSDGIADFGNLSSGESKDFLLVVEVPSGADLSTSNTFTIYANFSSNLSIHANVQDKATIDERIQIQKNESGKAGVGSYIYYRHNVTNSYNESDILNLNWTGTLGWTATFYEEDKITELTDTNSDSMIDTGPIGPYGESKNIYVKLSVPSDATDGTSELTYIQATSSLDPDHSDLVMDNTTAYYMLVFNDSGRTNVDQYYKRNERVYAEAYGLQGTGKVFFQWIDPNATVQRTSPTINVDAGGQAQDDYLLNLTAIFGQWTLVIYSSPGSAEITRSYFHVNAPPNVTVTVPNGGEDWGGLQTIHWNASDINEDSLTFNVYQSPDGGSNFYLIQGGLSNSTRSLLWDTTTANDNMQSLIRVCAYDPYDSSCDASDAYFTVNNTMGDHEAPSVLSVWSNPYIINQTQYTNLTANITDESGINFTLVEVSFANGTVKNYTLSNNSNIWYYVFNTTEDHLPGNYTYRIYAYDRVGNVNDSEWGWFYVNDISNNSPPGTITNLHATSIGTSWIRWNWTNPSDADFNHTMIYVNWMWQANLYTPVHSVNITGLLNNTDYTIAILTVDHDGNVNTTWVINTARTGTIADYTPPSVVSVWSVPYLINQTQYTNLTANITDDHRINFTLVEVIFANGTVKNYTMSNNSNIWYYVFNTTPSYIPGNYTYKIYSQDMNGNMNDSEGSWFYVNSLYDPYPPGTVTNLNAPSIGTSWIYWTWTNPPDVDFNHTIIYLNWIWQANLNTPVNSVNFSGLINNTDYTISILTADHSGNINTTWVIDTVRTGTSPDHDAPVFNESETRPSGEYNQSDDVLFLVSIDESATVSATLDYPNGSQQKISLSHNGTDWYYAAIFSQTYALGQYNITYNATDGNGNWNVTHANFTVNDVTAPSVPDVNPDGANYDINDSVYISANVTDAYYDNMGIVVANVSWGPTYEMINLSYNATSGLWGGVFTNTTSIDIYTIRIIATDNASNVNDSETAVFTVGDMFPPLFSLVEPNDDVFNQSDSVHVIVCVSENSTVTANITWDSTHEQAILEYNGTEWCYEYIFTNTTWIGVYNISFNATDEYGNWNITFTNFTVQELADEIPPGSVLNLGSPSQTNTSIFWNWVNPIDLDFNSTMIYIDNVWEINLSVPVNYYNKTGLTPDTNHTITIYTIDHVGNVNTTGVNDTNKTLENPDIVPPSSVSNLMSPSQTNSSIYWNWSNPADADFNGTVIFINGSWVANLSAPVNYYNLTGLMPDAYYEITIHTVDHDGNINDTDVSNVNKTLANTIIDTDAPVFGVVEPSDDTYNKSDTVTFVVCVDENATIAANVSWDSTYESVELVFNGTEWCYEYIFTNTTWIGVYNITLNATDELGNWNRTYTNFTIQDVIDMIPPNLTNITSEPISPVLNNGSEENISVNLTSDEYPINVTFLLYNWSGVIVDVQGPHVVQNSSVLPLTYTVPLGLADGNYTLNLTATDQYNNSVEVFVAVIEVVYPDTTPPGSIANLQSLSQTNSSIFWNWSNPVDADFNGTVIFINDSWVANLSAPVNFVNVTGLLSDTNYIITIHTRDHVGNVNDTGVSNINKTLANPVVDTDPPIFITVEPAGDVFNQSDDVMIIACVDENVTIAANVSWDSTYESAELVFNGTEWCYEYVFTNTSWPGLYDISLNATDVYGNWNVTETNFTIQDVTAPAVDILEPSSGSSIDQNDSVSIIINVTDPYHNNMGTVIANVTWDSTYEEINLVYNSTSGLWGGVFSDTTMLGEYNITIIATDNDGNRNESDTRFTVTDVQAEISTGYDIYAPDIEVEINGTGFSLNANVTINITNATSVIYTNLTTTDGAGEFSIIWLNSGTAEGDYTIIAADQYGRTANKTIQIITNYSFNGKIFDVNNNTWPADIRVYNSTGDLIAVDDELYNLTFDYGAEYDIFVYPHNNPLIQMLDFKYVANQGFLEDFLGLDYLLGFSDGTQYLEMGSYLPALTNYEYVIVTLQNQYNYGVEVFKCADYNFTGRDCLGLWDNIINMTKYQTINVTVYPGDPAFAAKKIDEGGSGTGGGSGGAGGGGGYTGLCSAKYYGCTEWSECTDGVQTRDCYFIYNCDPDSKRLMNESAELHETNGISEAWQLKELEQRKCAETEAGIEEPKDIELIEQMLSPVVSNAKKTGYYLVDKLGSARFRWMLYILLLTCISIVLNVYLNHDPEKMKKF